MSEAATISASFRDQSRGLTVFGAVLVVLGAVSVAMTVAMRFSINGISTNDWIFRLLTTGVNGVGMIWLGVGSLQARRWAAALIYCFGGLQLILETLALPGYLISYYSVSSGLDLITWLLVRLGLPMALLGFYCQPDVRRTCELRDPIERWTDRLPLPVLGCCIALAELIPRFLDNCLIGGSMPFFGHAISGPLARELWLAATLFTLYAVWGIYRFDRRAWSIFMVVFPLFGISSVLTLILLQPAADSFPPGFEYKMWSEAASTLTCVGYLICARFFFPPSARDSAA